MHGMDLNIENIIRRIREFRTKSGFAKTRLAVMAGIPEGCIRNIDEQDWNPTLVTLRKIEAVIPSDFQPEHSGSSPTENSTESKENRL